MPRTIKSAAPAPAPIKRAARPLTEAEKITAFRMATRSFRAWYAGEIAAGMTDSALASALEHGLGIMGGSSGPGKLDVSYQGAGLRIWAGWGFQNTVTDKPLFAGRATVAMAREVYGIANPQDRQMRLC
jgi:hypothetical protein